MTMIYISKQISFAFRNFWSVFVQNSPHSMF